MRSICRESNPHDWSAWHPETAYGSRTPAMAIQRLIEADLPDVDLDSIAVDIADP